MPVSLFENKPERCPFGHQLWPGMAQVSWTPCLCEPAREAAGRGRGMGHVRAAARPRAPAAHRLGDGTGLAALSASATTARATATADGRLGAATLTTLAFLPDVPWLAAAANAAGSGGRPSSLATRTVTWYLLGGSFMPGTVSVVCDISGRDPAPPPGQMLEGTVR